MRILLSIKPRFANLILAGEKKFEFRKTLFKDTAAKIILLYATSPVKKIIGQVEIEEILSDNPKALWQRTRNYAGLGEKEFFSYFSNQNKAHAIKIKNGIKYDDPIRLDKLRVFSAPQSFRYVK